MDFSKSMKWKSAKWIKQLLLNYHIRGPVVNFEKHFILTGTSNLTKISMMQINKKLLKIVNRNNTYFSYFHTAGFKLSLDRIYQTQICSKFTSQRVPRTRLVSKLTEFTSTIKQFEQVENTLRGQFSFLFAFEN